MQSKRLFQAEGPVAGVDEAGRGPLAGPVVAAAVILAPGQDIGDLRDSKKLTAASRERLAVEIRSGSLAWSVAWADRAEIDALNILHATMLAMRRAIMGLAIMPQAVQVDGNRLPNLCFRQRDIEGDAIVGGDARIPAISAASILAKSARDCIMVQMDALYPNYAFAQHKGYGTEMHRERLAEHGPCVLHRRSFAPVRAAS
ncbi:MAG: ribonuclease HII [Gammaproteobacteria bacterium]|nr:ribonuclease HII [Gammaproteobacteria bacterium]